MASVFDSLVPAQSDDLLSYLMKNITPLTMTAAGGTALATLLRGGTPGTTPQAVDQYIANSQRGLSDLGQSLSQFRAPEAVSRRTEGRTQELQRRSGAATESTAQARKLLAQSGISLDTLRGDVGRIRGLEGERTSAANSALEAMMQARQQSIAQLQFDKNKAEAEKALKDRILGIAQQFNRRGITPGSPLALAPSEEASAQFEIGLKGMEADLAQRRAEEEDERADITRRRGLVTTEDITGYQLPAILQMLQAEGSAIPLQAGLQDRITAGEGQLGEIERLRSQIPEEDFKQYIEPLLTKYLSAASPSTGAQLAQSGRNTEILSNALEKQSAAQSLGQLAMMSALANRGGGLSTGDGGIEALAKKLGIPASALTKLISEGNASRSAEELMGNLDAPDIQDFEVDEETGAGGLSDTSALLSGAGGASALIKLATEAGGIGAGGGGAGSTVAAQQALEAAASQAATQAGTAAAPTAMSGAIGPSIPGASALGPTLLPAAGGGLPLAVALAPLFPLLIKALNPSNPSPAERGAAGSVEAMQYLNDILGWNVDYDPQTGTSNDPRWNELWAKTGSAGAVYNWIKENHPAELARYEQRRYQEASGGGD